MYNVYRIRNLINDKSYIGQTRRDVGIRFNEHLHYDQGILYHAKLKYGKENLLLEVLESNIPESKVDDRERYYIKLFQTLAPNGYNLSRGGQSSKSVSEKGKESLSNANMGSNNPRSYGILHMVDPKTCAIVETFGSAREAGRFLGNENKYRSISNAVRSNREFNGFLWEIENADMKVSCIDYPGLDRE